MVEPIMYFAIGFLVSTLLGLAIVPLVHNRAVRLTTKRLEASTRHRVFTTPAGLAAVAWVRRRAPGLFR